MQALNQSFAQPSLSRAVLQQENRHFNGTGGVSGNNRSLGFRPAFLDTLSGRVYLSCFADGRPAPMHLLDGLPTSLMAHGSNQGCGKMIRATVISGFVRDEHFYTRQQAAEFLNQQPLQ